MKIHIRGNVLGRRLRSPMADIVHIPEASENGPPVNAFLLVSDSGQARFISWIGYFDVEYAMQREPGNWALVEPAQAFEKDAEWFPYGWDPADRVPTIGDTHLTPADA
jgi:hypothetical protein